MPWARLDERFPSHRKVRRLTSDAFRLHVSAICWSSENLTDGKILAGELTMVSSDVKKHERLAGECVAAGVWDLLPDGWLIHDYLLYNPSREKVLREREAKREAGRRGGQAKASALAGATAVARPPASNVLDPGGYPVPVPVPSSCVVDRSSPVTGREDEDRDLIAGSLDACRRLRPDWNELGIRRALKDATTKAGSEHRASIALLRVAAANDTDTPRRVLADGWWWDDTDHRATAADEAAATRLEESA